MGTSYMAWVQNALATQDPDGLAAMFVNQGAENAWEATLRHNSVFELGWLTWAFTYGSEGAKQCLNNSSLERLAATIDTRTVLSDEPLLEGQSLLRLLPKYGEYLFNYLTREGESEYWDNPLINFATYYDEMADVPTVSAGFWYDSYVKATSG